MIDLKLLPSLHRNGYDSKCKEIADEVKQRTDGVTIYALYSNCNSPIKVFNAFKDSKTDEVWGIAESFEEPQCYNIYMLYKDYNSAIDAKIKFLFDEIKERTEKIEKLMELKKNKDNDIEVDL